MGGAVLYGSPRHVVSKNHGSVEHSLLVEEISPPGGHVPRNHRLLDGDYLQVASRGCWHRY